jgi:hypothetical protein
LFVRTNRIESVYNLEVAIQHVYFVGENGLLVHNACTKQLRQALNTPVGGGAAHHIVAAGSKNIDAVAARDILKKAGIGTESHWNGVLLNSNLHSGIHTNRYYKNVHNALKGSGGSPNGVIKVLDDIRARLLRGDTTLWQ